MDMNISDIIGGMPSQAMKQAEDMASVAQGTLDAMIQSSQIWTSGMQDLSRQLTATAQSQLDQTLSTFKAFSGLRSLKDVLELQTSFARSSMQAAMMQSSRLTDAGLKLAEQTMAPLSARVSLAMDGLSKAA